MFLNASTHALLTAVLLACFLGWRWRSCCWWTVALWLQPPQRAWRGHCGCRVHPEPPHLTSTPCPSAAAALWSPPGPSSCPLQNSRHRLEGNTIIVLLWKWIQTSPSQTWLAGILMLPKLHCDFFSYWVCLVQSNTFSFWWFMFKILLNTKFLHDFFIYQYMSVVLLWK